MASMRKYFEWQASVLQIEFLRRLAMVGETRLAKNPAARELFLRPVGSPWRWRAFFGPAGT